METQTGLSPHQPKPGSLPGRGEQSSRGTHRWFEGVGDKTQGKMVKCGKKPAPGAGELGSKGRGGRSAMTGQGTLCGSTMACQAHSPKSSSKAAPCVTDVATDPKTKRDLLTVTQL